MFVMTDDFTVVERKPNGEVIEKRFTSHAQARQFMEKHAALIPPKRNVTVNRGAGRKPVTQLTREQKFLKDKAMEQLKGL